MPDENGKPLKADPNTPSPVLGNKTYDLLKDFVTVVFPAAVALYAGLGVLFGWDNVDKWVTAAGLVGVFLGVLLKVAAKRYANLPTQYDGALVANDPDPENETYRLEFDKGLVQLSNQQEVRLKVVDLLPKDAQGATPAD
jgi:hypothetical protein